LITNYEDETFDPLISHDKARELEAWLASFLDRGTPVRAVEEAFRNAWRLNEKVPTFTSLRCLIVS